MKIILHGATDFGSSNFGDFIYGDLVFSYLKHNFPDADIVFYNPSTFFLKNIKGYSPKKIKIKDADYIIYIPGGYFGEGHNARLKDNLFQYYRFMPVGIKALLFKKKLIVLGVGAGPNRNKLLASTIKKVCNNAIFVSVRDQESCDALQKVGVKNNILVGGDPLLVPEYFNSRKTNIDIRNKLHLSNNPILFVHYNHSELALNKFSSAVRSFIEKNPEYQIVVGSDQILTQEKEYYHEFSKTLDNKSIHYLYTTPEELTALLSQCNVVLTCKLHVGVISMLLNKSVICIAEHPEKTERFYKRINQTERCLSLYQTEPSEIVERLEKYKDIPVYLPIAEINGAKIHFDNLKKVMA